jgi:hypothetical protein
VNFNRILVGSNVGALTGFVRFPDNTLCGLSAFHVLSGSDRKIDPYDDIVEIRNTSSNRWLKFGYTVEGTFYKGKGADDDFGLLDFAYFEIYNSFIIRVRENLREIKLSEYLNLKPCSEMTGLKVFGYSAVDDKVVNGTIENIHFSSQANRYDVVIELENSFTQEGDSGMLWKDESGDALFMHLRGNSSNSATKSYASFMSRILKTEQSLFEYIDEKQL